MKIINEERYPLIPIHEYISILFEFLSIDPDKALVVVMNKEVENGYMIGIADKGIRGYTPTPNILETDYNTASDWIDKANELIFKRPPVESMKIVLSTMCHK